MSKEAMCIVLSERNRNDAVKVVNVNSKGEIKDIREKMEKNISKSTLVISDIENLKLAVRNIKGVNIVNPMRVNVKDVVKSKAIVIDKDSVNKLENRLLNGK
jgi:ribosomal protein L4